MAVCVICVDQHAAVRLQHASQLTTPRHIARGIEADRLTSWEQRQTDVWWRGGRAQTNSAEALLCRNASAMYGDAWQAQNAPKNRNLIASLLLPHPSAGSLRNGTGSAASRKKSKKSGKLTPLPNTTISAHSVRPSLPNHRVVPKPTSRSVYLERVEEASKMSAMVALRNSLRATAVSRKIGMHQQFVRTASLATVSSLGIDKATGITKPVGAMKRSGRK